MDNLNNIFVAESEALALRSRIADLEAQLASRRPQKVAFGSGLVDMVSDALPSELRADEILLDREELGLTITLVGLTADNRDRIVPLARPYEVRGTISVPVSFTVLAQTPGDAEDFADDIASDLAASVNIDEVDHDALEGSVVVDSADYDVMYVTN